MLLLLQRRSQIRKRIERKGNKMYHIESRKYLLIKFGCPILTLFITDNYYCILVNYNNITKQHMFSQGFQNFCWG